jgi:hypothetical protein
MLTSRKTRRRKRRSWLKKKVKKVMRMTVMMDLQR